MNFLFSCFYFALPIYFANITPPIARKLRLCKFLDKPVDFGKTLKNTPILGSHKTWRGIILGTIIGTLMFFLQVKLYEASFFQRISFLNYKDVNPFLFGFLLSFGAMFGDSLFSFLKRQLKISPGKSWMPFDQIDYIIGAFILITPFLKLDPLVWIYIIFLTFFLHITFNRLGYELKINKNKW